MLSNSGGHFSDALKKYVERKLISLCSGLANQRIACAVLEVKNIGTKWILNGNIGKEDGTCYDHGLPGWLATKASAKHFWKYLSEASCGEDVANPSGTSLKSLFFFFFSLVVT